MTALFERASQLGRNATPAIITLFLVFFTLMPLNLPGSEVIMPPLALMAVYYWSIYRPDLMPAAMAFAAGLMFDMLSGGPPGLHAFVFVVVQAVAASQRSFFLGKVFPVEWLGFCLVAAATFLVLWALGSLYVGAIVKGSVLAIQALLTITLYPIMTWFMVRARRAVSGI